jgi:hypothetical protein
VDATLAHLFLISPWPEETGGVLDAGLVISLWHAVGAAMERGALDDPALNALSAAVCVHRMAEGR